MKILAMMLAIGASLALAAIAADEITVTTYMKVDNGYYQFTKNIPGLKVDQLGDSMQASIQSIQTGAWEQVVISNADLATNGYSFFRCTDTNTDRWIDVGNKIGGNYVANQRYYAGDVAVIPLHPTNTVWATAGSTYTGAVAGVNLEFWNNER